MKGKALLIVPAIFLLLVILACGSSGPETAKAVLVNNQGQQVGEATFAQTPVGVEIVLTVQGLPPGWHAVHVHEKGDCHPHDFMSAGGHFNPYGKQHGFKNPQGPHAGDLPDIFVGADGKGGMKTVAPLLTLGPGKNSLFQPGGTSLMIHAQPDDDMTDPAGNAGARIACGPITP